MTAASKGAKGQRERPDALSWELQQAWKADSPCPRGREKVVYHDLCHRRVSKDSHWPKTLAVSLFKDLFFPTIYFPNRVEKGYPQTETEKATQAHCCHPKPSLEYVSEPCISGDDSRLAALCWRATSDLLSSYSHTDVGGCLKHSSLGQGHVHGRQWYLLLWCAQSSTRLVLGLCISGGLIFEGKFWSQNGRMIMPSLLGGILFSSKILQPQRTLLNYCL